jgi:HEAT repeat protein
MARYALERIPGPAVDKALRAALNRTSGKVKVGIINSLGERSDRKAVKQLGKLLTDTDKEIVQAAISALGKIGGKGAAKALDKARAKVGPELYLSCSDAYLMCADKFLARGDKKSAMRIYRQLYVPDEPAVVRVAAFRGMVTAGPEKAVDIVVGVLKGDDEGMQAVAIGLLREIPGTKMIEAVTAELPNLSVAGQVQVLSALGDRGDRAALGAVVNAVKSSEADVRIAAFGALGALGDASSVDLLAQAAAAAKGAEQEAARQGLYRLRGEGVDEEIGKSILEAAGRVKVELIRSIGQRNVVRATPMLLRVARVRERRVCLESLKVLKVIAEPKDLPALVGLMIYARSEAERSEAENTVAAVARKIEDKNRRAARILAILPSVKELRGRCSMLNVLGKIGDDSAVPALRAALRDENATIRYAAVRALSEWPGDEPMDDLLKIAQSSDDQRERILALRGFVRLVGLDRDRPAEQTVKMYQQAMELAPNVSEKRMVLSGLANVKSFAALQMAADYLEDSALQQEAEVAAVKVAESTHGSHPKQTRAVLQRVIQTSKNDSVRQRAQELIKQIEQEEARSEDKSGAPGSAIKLIGGDFSAWRENTGTWQIAGDVSMDAENEKRLAAKPGSAVFVNGPEGRTVDLFSKAEFSDVKAHIEFVVPRKSNSGVYFMGRYEIQILDSWGVREPKFSDCGGIYQRWDGNRTPKGYEGHPPRTNASLPPGQWQTYDVIFRVPCFDESGKKIANARFEKVVHNGIVVHENVEVTWPTRASAYQDEKPAGPLMLQGDHGPVAYRNIWILPLE